MCFLRKCIITVIMALIVSKVKSDSDLGSKGYTGIFEDDINKVPNQNNYSGFYVVEYTRKIQSYLFAKNYGSTPCIPENVIDSFCRGVSSLSRFIYQDMALKETYIRSYVSTLHILLHLKNYGEKVEIDLRDFISYFCKGSVTFFSGIYVSHPGPSGTIQRATIAPFKDDTEVLELDDAGNSIAEQIITNSNAVKRSGNLTANGYPSSQSHPVSHSKYEHDNDDESNSVGLCYWTIFQAVGLTCVAVIICRSIVYQQGFFDSTNQNGSTSINKRQFSNWHFSLTTVGFVYLYANSVFLIKDKKSSVTLPYVMLHTFAAIVSALGLYAMYFDKEIGKSPDAKFYEGHLYSIHSWTGALAAAMFAVQWLSAIFTFMMPCLRAVGLPLGKMFSLYTVMVSTIALACGVNEHAVKALKEEYKSYSIESLILNGFTMLIVLFLFLIAFNIIKTYRK